MSRTARPDTGLGDPRTSKALPLYDGVTATVSSDEETGWVFLSISDAGGGAPLTLQIPSREASDLAVLLVNAANGL